MPEQVHIEEGLHILLKLSFSISKSPLNRLIPFSDVPLPSDINKIQ